jgi:hypothetical protein
VRSRLFWPLGLAVCAALAAGCNARPLNTEGTDAATGGGGGLGLAGAGGGTFTPTRKVDILFVIDDSSETVLLQRNLLSNFPTLMTTLRNGPSPPDLRIAVVSTDMGAGDGSIAGCTSTGGKNAIFQYTARGACSATGLAPGATYIVDTGTVRNYSGNLEDVFACIAALGETGCGFEHQLASMARALGADGLAPPQENQGFLRPEAYLFVVIMTNEDDCSAPSGSALYDTAQTKLQSVLGPPANFRCNEFGHLCNGAKPPRLAPTGNVTDTVTLDGCVSAEGAGMLIPVADVVAQIRALKRFPDEQIVVTAIAGPPSPYTVKWRTPPTADTGPWPEIAHSCVATDASVADPAIRIAKWVQAFGPNGLLLSACDANLAQAATRLGELLDRAP